jgi:PKD repeat protein
VTATDSLFETVSDEFVLEVVHVNEPPVAETGGPYYAQLGEDIALSAGGSHDPDESTGDSIVGYTWSIAGGIYERTGAAPSLTPAEIEALGLGVHPVMLSITDSFGATATAMTTLEIYDNRPFAALAVEPAAAVSGQTVTFDASSSSHGRPDRSIVGYTWDFGDGSSYTETAAGAADGSFDGLAAHSYGALGSYYVTLTVTDDNAPAKTDTASVIVEVRLENHAPVANPGGPYEGRHGQGLLLDGSGSSDPDSVYGDTIESYRWDLGDDGQWDYTGSQVTVPWADLSGLPHQQTIPLRLEVTDKLGWSGSAVTHLTIPESLGPVDFVTLPSLAPSGGVLQYHLETTLKAELTLEALASGVQIELLDAERRELKISHVGGTGQRLDWPAEAGQTFYVRLSGTAESVDLRIANLVRHAGKAVTIHGTAVDDTFALDASTSLRQVTINGIAYGFTADAATSFTFEGLDGADDVQLVGSEGIDTAILRPRRAVLTGAGYKLIATQIESSTFDGGGGEDVASLYGNQRQKETVIAGGQEPGADSSRTTIAAEGVSITATAEKIHVFGRGGNDVAHLYGSAGDDKVLPYWKWTTMFGPGYFRKIRGVKTTYAYAGDGYDTAGFRDSAFDDLFQGRPGLARMFYAPGQYKEATGFERVNAFSDAGKDKAGLWDTSSDDSLEALPRKVTMTRSNGTSVMVQRFQTINLFSQAADDDKAILVDAVVDQATYGPPEGVALDDLAQILWLNFIEKIELGERPTNKASGQINGVDQVFAYWQ